MAELIHDTILVPHGTHPGEVMRRALAQAEAKTKLGPGESIEELRLGQGRGTGPTSPMMKWDFNYQILRPGGSVVSPVR